MSNIPASSRSPHSLESPVAPFTVSVLGPMQVLVEGRPLPHLHSRKSLWLLAFLVLRNGRPVERELLANVLWPDVEKSNAFANLRPVLSQLRTALGSQGFRLRSTRHTLALDLEDAEVDVLLFDAAIARRKREPHNSPDVLAALETALASYRGPLLEGCAEEWVGQERRLREQEVLQALQTLAEGAAAAHDDVAAARYWQRAVTLDPLWEAARRGAMEALARTGDSNAALQVYRNFVALLRNDPKAVPDAATTALYQRLRGEGQPRAKPPQPAPTPAATGYLPHALTALIGREDECREVAKRLQRSRLVTLTGPGGIGKTRLALALAADLVGEYAEYSDGVCLVALDTLADGRHVYAQIAAALGVKESAGKTLPEAVTAHLRGKRLLLVLDNCEHLLAASAEAAGYILQKCAGVRILATSRTPLGITGETAWAMPGLATPDLLHLPTGPATRARAISGYESVQLFVERAQAVQKSFALTGENALAVAQVCVRLEGIPLAIELAAARVRAITVFDIARRLDDYLGLLTDGSRDAPLRQQTLRATLDWSYDLLEEPERLLLARLSVFAGGWSLPAAEQVCAGEGLEAGQVLNLLTRLTDRSLIVFEASGGDRGGRYRLLEAVRHYAGERQEARGETDRVRTRHRDWYLAFAEEAEPHLIGPEEQDWLRRLSEERDNLRGALEWSAADPRAADTGLRLANALRQFWYARGDYSEGRLFLEKALEREREQAEESGTRNVALRAKGLNGLAGLALRQGDTVGALPLYEESLRLYREMSDVSGVARQLNNLAAILTPQGEYARARALYEESLRIQRALGDRAGIALALGNLGNVTRMQGDLDAAREMYEQSLQLYRALGYRRRIQWALLCVANIRAAQGDRDTARTLAEESLTLAREAGEKPGLTESLITLGTLFYEQDDPEVAQPYFEESLQLAREMGGRPLVAWALLGLGETRQAQTDLAGAHERYEEALRIFRELGQPRGEGWALQHLGAVTLYRGDPAAAQAFCQESVAILHALGDQEGVARSLSVLAAVMRAQEREAEAARLLGASAALCETFRILFPARERKERDRHADGVRAALGDTAFTEAWNSGLALVGEKLALYAAGLSR